MIKSKTAQRRNIIEKAFGYTFKNPELLQEALTHSSFANEHRVRSNERLEFLGDSVLGFIMADILFQDASLNEGALTRTRSSLVSEEPLAFLADQLNISACLKRGVGEQKNVVTKSMKADMVEAILGAIYMDSQSIQVVKSVIQNLFTSVLKNTHFINAGKDAKTSLQEIFGNEDIRYVVKSIGTLQDPLYDCKLYIKNQLCGKATATTKKKAEKLSAEQALQNIKKV